MLSSVVVSNKDVAAEIIGILGDKIIVLVVNVDDVDFVVVGKLNTNSKQFSSSDPSLHSGKPSQIHVLGMQEPPSLHENQFVFLQSVCCGN